MARHFYDLVYDGIYYQSRHGRDLENWAIFEPFRLTNQEQWDLNAVDPDFKDALSLLINIGSHALKLRLGAIQTKLFRNSPHWMYGRYIQSHALPLYSFILFIPITLTSGKCGYDAHNIRRARPTQNMRERSPMKLILSRRPSSLRGRL